MAGRIVYVVAPSRLHFGLFSFGQVEGPKFGGVGLMIDNPQLRLTIAPADLWEVHVAGESNGPVAARIQRCADRLVRAGWLRELPRCRVELESLPRQHAGLGSGTQLALSVATGLNAFVGGPQRSAEELATATGRGARSAIGIHGFLKGGLLIEMGKRAGDPLGTMYARATLPSQWRFVLLCPPGEGLSGDEERQAFERLSPVPAEVSDALRNTALREMLPTAKAGDFERFSKALYEFGHRAGDCFAALQGGPYRGHSVGKLVETLRGMGIEGVGQSSWGPTVFALHPDEEAALRTVEQLKAHDGMHDVQITVASPQNLGARIEVMACEQGIPQKPPLQR